MKVHFDEHEVFYDFDELEELSPAYAIIIYKPLGSEFPAVVMALK